MWRPPNPKKELQRRLVEQQYGKRASGASQEDAGGRSLHDFPDL
jgi:hypothetical protein